MVSFRALNQAEDDEELWREKQSRTQEIQLESGLKLYESAISAFRNKEWDKCSAIFDELFDIDVLYEDLVPENNTSKLNRLRFLAFKSFALFDLARIEVLDPTNQVRIQQAMENLIESLAFDDNDPVSWRRVAELARKLDYPRIEQFALESARSTGVCHFADEQIRILPLCSNNPEYKISSDLLNNCYDSFKRDVTKIEKYDMYPWIHIDKRHKTTTISNVINIVKPNWESLVSHINLDYAGFKIRLICEPEEIIEEDIIIENYTDSENYQASCSFEPMNTRTTRRSNLDCNDLPKSTFPKNSFHSFVRNLDTLLQVVGIDYGQPETFLKNTYFVENQKSYTIYETLKSFVSTEYFPEAIDRFFFKKQNCNSPVNANQLLLLDLSTSSETLEWNKKLEVKHFNKFYSRFHEKEHSFNYFLLSCLLAHCLRTEDNFTSYLHCHWSKPLKKFITNIAAIFEFNLFNLLIKNCSAEYLCLAQTIFELFLDDAVEEYREADLSFDEEFTEDFQSDKVARCQRWSILTNQYLNQFTPQLYFRCLYSQIVLLRLIRSPNEIVEDHLKELETKFQGEEPITLMNCQSVSKISKEAINVEMCKVQTIHFFTSLFESRQNLDYESVIQHLATVLLNYETQNEQLRMSMSQFIEKTSTDFKLFLWDVLKEAYEHKHDVKNAALCISFEFDLLTQSIVSKGPLFAPGIGITVLLFYLGNAYRLLTQLTDIIKDHHDAFDAHHLDHCKLLMEALAFLSKIYIYFNFLSETQPEMLKTNNDKNLDKFMSSFKNGNVMLWIATYVIFKRMLVLLKLDITTHASKFLSIVHEELGLLQFCSAKDFSFVDLALHEFMSLDMSENESEILQCLHCIFGISVGTEYFFPFDHLSSEENGEDLLVNTNRKKLETTDAAKLVPFLLRFAVRKKYGWIMSRNDQKQAFDEICKSIGPPDMKSHYISHNKSVLESFLDSELSGKECLHIFKRPLTLNVIQQKDTEPAFDVYYTQAELSLGQFKSRQKTIHHSLNTDELDQAKQYFIYDLLCKPDRVESWFGLAETFKELVEAMITSGTEYFSSHFTEILENLKNCIQSCLMAISWFLCNESCEVELNTILLLLCQNLYLALTPPFNSKVFINIDGKTRRSLFKLVHKMLQIISNLNTEMVRNDWSFLCFRANVILKARLDPLQALDLLVQAVQLEQLEKKTTLYFTYTALPSPNSFMPHYKLASKAYKLVKSKKIEIEKAVKLLSASKYFFTAGETGPLTPERFFTVDTEAKKTTLTESEFIHFILYGLDRIRQADKKKWYHRPIYRTAQILVDELDEPEYGKEILSVLFSYKASGKAFITVWRNEIERPGRHYVYVSQYTKFLIKILEKTMDFNDLRSLGKRLRRSAGSFLNIREVWSYYCETMIRCWRFIYNLTEEVPYQIVLDSCFDQRVNEWCADIESGQANFSDLSSVLRDLCELKKMNSSWYSNDEIENLISCVFCKIYSDRFNLDYDEDSTISLRSREEDERSKSTLSIKNLMTSIPTIGSTHKIVLSSQYPIPENTTESFNNEERAKCIRILVKQALRLVSTRVGSKLQQEEHHTESIQNLGA